MGEYSPFSLDIESERIGLLKACRELGCAIVPYSPIGRGMLGGTIRSPADFEEGALRKFAPRFSDENLGALHLKLSNDEEQEIRKACEAAEVHGGRYPEAFASACFADTPPLNA